MNNDQQQPLPPSGIRSFRAALRRLEREIEAALASQTACCGVTGAQCHALLELDLTGASSVSQLAASLNLDVSPLSRTIDGLVQAGLVSRQAEAGNRRRLAVALTTDGQAKADFINQACDEQYSSLREGLPPKLRGAALAVMPPLVEAMRQARAKLVPGGGPCCR